jgi:tetratricopeptide (TPR) repeat protein
MVTSVQQLPDLTAAAEPAVRNAAALERITPSERDLLREISCIYLACGQADKALALIRLAARCTPDDIGCLRVLAYALLVSGRGEEALVAVDRLTAIDHDRLAPAYLQHLQSHALRLAGRTGEARLSFQQFIAARSRQPTGDAT